MPAIYSPEMAMAGFGMLGDILPAINYVARLDGATQYWQLSEGGISLSVGDIVTFKYKTYGNGYSPEGQISSFFDTDTQRVRFRASNSVQANISGGGLEIDGVIYNNNDQLPDGSSVHFVSFTVTESTLLEVLGGSWWGGTLMPLPIFEFSVSRNGNVLNEIPLTNKAQGATQLATVGSVNATLINYTEAVWEVLPEPEPINYVARLNGTDQHWQLSEAVTIPASTDFEIIVSFFSQSSSAMVLASSEQKPFIYVRSDGKAVFEPEDGVFVVLPNDVLARNVDLSIKLSGSILTISEFGADNETSKSVADLGQMIFRFVGARIADGLASFFLDGYVKNLRIYDGNGVLTHQIPLTNKSQGATQLATVGNVNATMVGYTPDVWEIDTQ